MNNKTIILARYNEDINWLKDSDQFDEIFIYDKGEDKANIVLDNVKVNILSLPNIGRETHTYLTHIINNYDVFLENPNKTYIFSQGYPLDHSPFFLINIKNFPEIICPFVHLAEFKAITHLFAYHGNKDHHFNGIPYINYLNRLFFKENTFVENFDNMLPFLRIDHSSIFAVLGSSITFRKKEFYIDCLNMIKESINPFECYIFERLWQIIFDRTTMDWISHYNDIREKYASGFYKGVID